MINNVYKSHLVEIKESFDGAICLPNFFDDEFISFIKNQASQFKSIYLPNEYKYKEKEINLGAYKMQLKMFLDDLFRDDLELISAKLKLFEHTDYTLLTDAEEYEGPLVILDLNELKEEMGGFTLFQNENSELFRIIPKANQLFILNKTKEMFSYIKYLNCLSTPRLFLEVRYE